MSLPQALYLKGSDGRRVGPIALQWLEVLFDARVVDESTPISLSGKAFRPVSDWPDILERLNQVKEALRGGQNPWTDTLEARPVEESALRVEKAVQATGEEGRPLAMLVRLASARADGRLTVERPGSQIRLLLRDGRYTGLSVEDSELDLVAHLRKSKLVSPAALEQAQQKAPQFGGDVGAALVATGAIPGDLFFETYANWAQSVLAQVLLRGGQLDFDDGPGSSPPIPLSFDRFGVFLEAIRLLPRGRLSEHLAPSRTRPLVLSQIEGVSREALQLKPRELRVLNSINGARTLADLMDELGTSDEMTFDILRTIFFATEAGLVVLGDDPLYKQEKAQLEQLRKELERLQGDDEFQVLGVNAESSNEEVRSAYTELAKKYHPDGLRREALPELRKLMERAFARIGEAFAAIDSPGKRKRRAEEIASNDPDARAAEARAMNAATAEALFKKAEILVRVRKYEEALEFLEQAIQLNPDEIDYKILRVDARYRLNTKGDGTLGATEAIEEVASILGTHESLLGFQTLGQLNKTLGRSEEALRFYRRVLDLDPNHAEAKTEVRIATLRKEKTKKNKRGWLS